MSSTSSNATSSSITHCFLYESAGGSVSAECGWETARNGRLRTFDGRVIFVDEVALDELDGQTTLSNTTTTDYDELVFPEELHGDG